MRKPDQNGHGPVSKGHHSASPVHQEPASHGPVVGCAAEGIGERGAIVIKVAAEDVSKNKRDGDC